MFSLFRNFLSWCLSEQEGTTLSIAQYLGAQYSRCLSVQVQLEEDKIAVYSSLYSHCDVICSDSARRGQLHSVQLAVLALSSCLCRYSNKRTSPQCTVRYTPAVSFFVQVQQERTIP